MQAAAAQASAAASSRCVESRLPHSPSVASSWHWALKAKGREWATVLIVRVNEETLPLSMPTDDEEGCSPEQLAEERRLLYVAMTRAKSALLMSHIALGPDRVERELEALEEHVHLQRLRAASQF